jgi:Ras-related protein Rab-6A
MGDESMNVEDVLKYKMIFIGDQSTGKSCILNRFANNQFDEHYQATIGLDFQSKNILIKDQDVRLLLYDTAGQEKFRSLIPMYIRESHIVLFVYDITRKESFDSIPKWFSDVLDIKSNEAVFVLIGNKIDLENERKVSFEQGKKFADEKNIIFGEVSAKTGDGFEILFREHIFELIYIKFKKDFEKKNLLDAGYDLNDNLDDEKNKDNIDNNHIKIEYTVNEKNKEKKKKKCC